MPRPSDPHEFWLQETRHHRRCPREDHYQVEVEVDRLYGHCPVGEWDEGLARWLVAHAGDDLGMAA